jgi:hypothetical protein
MASNAIVWDGLAEFYDFLRTLPRDLGADAAPIVTHAATLAEGEIRQRYGDRKTGNLARGLKMTTNANPYGALAIVRNTAKHAAWHEYGTQTRQTKIGANRGAMPPAKLFIPIVMKHRRAMFARLVALVERNGFTVG